MVLHSFLLLCLFIYHWIAISFWERYSGVISLSLLYNLDFRVFLFLDELLPKFKELRVGGWRRDVLILVPRTLVQMWKQEPMQKLEPGSPIPLFVSITVTLSKLKVGKYWRKKSKKRWPIARWRNRKLSREIIKSEKKSKNKAFLQFLP